MNRSKIEWCDYTFNPVTGCLHCCEYCFAAKIARRFGGKSAESGTLHVLDELVIAEEPECDAFDRAYGVRDPLYAPEPPEMIYKRSPYPYGFDPTFHRYRLNEPQRVKKPQTIFVCSMADLFGSWVPDAWIEEVFDACRAAPQHRYLFLTKNPARYKKLTGMNAPPNIWFGMTQTSGFTGGTKMFVPSNTKTFISIEPILDAFLGTGVNADWVIVGAMTGPGAKAHIPKRKWIEAIVNRCKQANIPIFLKNNLAAVWGEPLIQEYPW